MIFRGNDLLRESRNWPRHEACCDTCGWMGKEDDCLWVRHAGCDASAYYGPEPETWEGYCPNGHHNVFTGWFFAPMRQTRRYTTTLQRKVIA